MAKRQSHRPSNLCLLDRIIGIVVWGWGVGDGGCSCFACCSQGFHLSHVVMFRCLSCCLIGCHSGCHWFFVVASFLLWRVPPKQSALRRMAQTEMQVHNPPPFGSCFLVERVPAQLHVRGLRVGELSAVNIPEFLRPNKMCRNALRQKLHPHSRKSATQNHKMAQAKQKRRNTAS